MNEHEILVAIVVRTPDEYDTSLGWLQETLLWKLGPEEKMGDGDYSHIDSWWLAEDARPLALSQAGLSSAVFVPLGMSQEEADSILTREIRKDRVECTFCDHVVNKGNDMYDHVVENHEDELLSLGVLLDRKALARSKERIAIKNSRSKQGL